MLGFLFQGAAIGLTAAGAPGPLSTFLISRSLTGGWRQGALVALAPLISDPLIVLAILLLLDQLPASFLLVISLVGGVYVLYLAWGLLNQWRKGSQELASVENNRSGNLRKAALMNFLSPGPYAFWTLVNGPILLSALKVSVWYGIAFLLGFYGVFIGGMVALAIIFDQARRLGPGVVRGMLLASILILTLFGVLLVYKGVSGLIG
jgi:threonine/homoserine/homoserine lactone efflux protein